jgi:hypothetical protein
MYRVVEFLKGRVGHLPASAAEIRAGTRVDLEGPDRAVLPVLEQHPKVHKVGHPTGPRSHRLGGA